MDLQQRDIERSGERRFSRRAIVLGGGGVLAAGTLMPLIAACGKGSSTVTTGATTSSGGGSTATAGSTAAATAAQSEGNPVSGGTLTLGYPEPPTMDPRVSGSTTAWLFFYNLFDQLVEQSEDGNSYVPGLATKWDIATDGKSFTFTLQQNVKFHDGTPLTPMP